METQLKAYYLKPEGLQVLTLFGYATKGIPSLEVNGVGKLSKNIKEKLIFLTRNRHLNIPLRRYVVCVDQNDGVAKTEEELKWLEFPLLLIYWYMAGLVPIKKLDNCITSGWIKPDGTITINQLEEIHKKTIEMQLSEKEKKHLLYIGNPYASISSELLFEHIEDLEFKYV